MSEKPKEYPSISEHFNGTHDSQHPSEARDSIQAQVWRTAKLKDQIPGEIIHPNLKKRLIEVEVGEAIINGEKRKVAVTSFKIGDQKVIHEFPASRKAIINHVFILNGQYNKDELIQAIKDNIDQETNHTETKKIGSSPVIEAQRKETRNKLLDLNK